MRKMSADKKPENKAQGKKSNSSTNIMANHLGIITDIMIILFVWSQIYLSFLVLLITSNLIFGKLFSSLLFSQLCLFQFQMSQKIRLQVTYFTGKCSTRSNGRGGKDIHLLTSCLLTQLIYEHCSGSSFLKRLKFFEFNI